MIDSCLAHMWDVENPSISMVILCSVKEDERLVGIEEFCWAQFVGILIVCGKYQPLENTYPLRKGTHHRCFFQHYYQVIIFQRANKTTTTTLSQVLRDNLNFCNLRNVRSSGVIKNARQNTNYCAHRVRCTLIHQRRHNGTRESSWIMEWASMFKFPTDEKDES